MKEISQECRNRDRMLSGQLERADQRHRSKSMRNDSSPFPSLRKLKICYVNFQLAAASSARRASPPHPTAKYHPCRNATAQGC